ncbi:hypothetical protein, partial [Methylotenera sp.]|uniref:hypothetical protein n=1 Tax=Methylotenera sp. TaxID=2051956 RepID=UPI0024899E47
MRKQLIINDLHLGVTRSAGTTPKTAFALKAYLLAKVRALMFAHLDKDIIFNGDIFDVFNVSLNDAFDFYLLCREWLEATASEPHVAVEESDPRLILAEGNHDLSKNSANMCSLEFVVGALNSDRVTLVDKALLFPASNILIIPHVANQDMFDMEMDQAAEFKDTLILVHANYDNHFAVQSDHSLNVSEERAKMLTANNNTLMFGHVHQQARPMKNVIVAGNQFPSSVADCLGNDTKQAFIFDPSSRSVNSITTWTASESFAQIPWDELGQAGDFEFVRVIGKCPTEQAAAMLSEISKYRQRSSAYVVTNAVSVAGVADMIDLPSSLEVAKGFDVMAYLFENLEEPQVKVVKELLEKHN